MTLRRFQCLLCERFHGNESRPTCDDFPKGIPSELWLDLVEHNTTFKNKNEKLFKPIEEILKTND